MIAGLVFIVPEGPNAIRVFEIDLCGCGGLQPPISKMLSFEADLI